MARGDRDSDIIRHAPDGICLVQRGGRLLEVNEAFATSHGYTVAEMAGMHLAEVDPHWAERFGELSSRLEAGEAITFEAEHRRRDGSTFPLEVNARLVHDEAGPVVVAFHHDLTEARRAATALRESEYFFRESQTAAFIGSYRMDIAAARWTSSGVLDEIFGIGPDFDRTTEGWLSFVHPDDREEMGRYLAEEVIAARRPFDKEYRIIRVNDGATRWVAGRGRVLRDASGAAVSMLGTIQDVTDRVEAEATQSRLESMLVAAQKMEAIGRLAGGVAHDFNNMLTVILGNAEAALEEAEPGSSLRASLTEIRTAALRSAELTRQLLAFARKQVITPKVHDLNTVVVGMLSMLRRLIGENIELTWEPGADLWPVMIDAVQVDQILANLCVNARDALEQGGVVDIQTGNRVVDEAFCLSHPESTPGEYVCLTVRDNGVGMDHGVLGQLFEPFFTTKDVGLGTGLGLATVYGIVRQNAGFIDVASAIGEGTTFSIYFPRHRGPVESRGDDADAAGGLGQARGRILVVEDEPAILRAVARRLGSRGFEVLTAGTPAEALRHATASSGPIDLLLSDVILPGANGRDLAAQIVGLHPACKQLFMSGYSMDFISDHGVLEEGMHFIQKPMRFDDLDAKVQALLATGQD